MRIIGSRAAYGGHIRANPLPTDIVGKPGFGAAATQRHLIQPVLDIERLGVCRTPFYSCHHVAVGIVGVGGTTVAMGGGVFMCTVLIAQCRSGQAGEVTDGIITVVGTTALAVVRCSPSTENLTAAASPNQATLVFPEQHQTSLAI